jgi:hypothetical protein
MKSSYNLRYAWCSWVQPHCIYLEKRGKRRRMERTNPKARAEAQQIVTTRLLYCLHHPVS